MVFLPFFVHNNRRTSNWGKSELLKSLQEFGSSETEMTVFKASVNLGNNSIYKDKQEVLALYKVILKDQNVKNYRVQKKAGLDVLKPNVLTSAEKVF